MIRVLFDSVEINGNYIQNITQTVQPYTQNFLLGSTICRQFDIDIRNEGFNSIPNFVYLYEDNNSNTQSDWTKYATLLVDSSELSNQNYTTFHLTDMMVRLNTELEYTLNQSILTIVQAICTKHNINLVNQSFYMSDFLLTWQEDILERDLIGYIAEVNGGYAYINEDGNLVIAQYERIPVDTVDINKCSSYLVGEHHLIDRVYVDFAIASQSFPEESENDTVYLNPANFLITDSQNYTVEKTLRHIHSIIKGFEFYNIEIEQCPINPNIKTGQLIGVGNWGYLTTDDNKYIITKTGEKILISDGLVLPFICTIDWKYNTMWMGGYKTDLECKIQEETAIATTQEKLYKINFKVDKENGEIRQEISDLDNSVTASLALKIDKTDNNQIVSMINASANVITLNSNRLIINSDNFKLSQDGTIQCTNGTFSGTITGTTINGGTISGTSIEVGGQGNEDGTITVYNASGDEIGKWDKDGISISSGSISGSTLIFGDYPNGQYIETSGQSYGVLFNGSGSIYLKPKIMFDLQVANSDESNFYTQITGQASSLYLKQNDYFNNYEMANRISFSITSNKYRSLEMGNFIIGHSGLLTPANDLVLSVDETNSSYNIHKIELINYWKNGRKSNKLTLDSRESTSSLSLANFDTNETEINNIVLDYTPGTSMIQLASSINTLNQIQLISSSSGGKIDLASGNSNITINELTNNKKIQIYSSGDVYIQGHKLVFSTISGTKYVTWS